MENRSFTRICCSSSVEKALLKNSYLLMEDLFKFNGTKLQAQALHVEPELFYPPNLSLQIFWTNFPRKSLEDFTGFIYLLFTGLSLEKLSVFSGKICHLRNISKFFRSCQF